MNVDSEMRKDTEDEGMKRIFLPTAIAAAVALRNLYRLRYYYPDVIEVTEARRWHEELIGHLESTLRNIGIEGIDNIYKRPEFEDLKAEYALVGLYSVLVGHHPDCEKHENISDASKKNFDNVVRKCNETAFKPVREIIEQLREIMIYDCRIPNPTDDPTFREPRRFVQILTSYWVLCKKIILHLKDFGIGLLPHPLTPLIINIRARIDVCFEHLSPHVDISEAKNAVDGLLNILLSSELDDLSVVPEWTIDEIQKVDLFLEQTKLRLGYRKYPLTDQEEGFVNHVENEINIYHNKVEKAWKQVFVKAKGLADRAVNLPQANSESDKSNNCEIEANESKEDIAEGFPDPLKYTTAKYWIDENDSALHLTSKTQGREDGHVIFGLLRGEKTLQLKLMALLVEEGRQGVTVARIMEVCYPDALRQVRDMNFEKKQAVVKKVSALVSDIRTKKLACAGINPDIITPLKMSATKDSKVYFRVAELINRDAEKQIKYPCDWVPLSENLPGERELYDFEDDETAEI